jgi:hypothetical protein
VVQNFFNRSPITLKFGAEKLERESQERERESESESESKRESEGVRAHAIASNLLFYACKLMFVLVICYFTCNL